MHLANFELAAAVGTVQVRSLVEPLRKIVARLRGHVLCAKVCRKMNIQGVVSLSFFVQAVDLVMAERLVEVEVINPDGVKQNIYVP